ncbi:MAG TPA: P-loop NTPase [Jatrophihabitans sp.]|uniref:AAA family ATPase n=1 Tax=Jatrophihabitans sp. TaxID=1932789 RepID=UPI002EF8D8F1
MTIVCEPDLKAALVLATSIGGDVRIVSAPGMALALLVNMTGRHPVVIGATVGLDEALRFTARVTEEHPAALVILIRQRLDDAEVARAIAAGAHAVLDSAVHDEIAHACSAATAPRTGGQIFAVLAAKGGCGKTTLATNLAVALQGAGERRVCLLDLDLEYGDIASALDLDTSRTLSHLIGKRDVGGLLDTGDLITASAESGLDCILAPVTPGDARRIRPAKIGLLLRALTRRYDVIVIDLPARFSPAVLVALDHAQHQVVVATPERPVLKHLRITLDILDLLGYRRTARAVLFNRSDPRVAITEGEGAAVVRGPVAAHVPTSVDVAASINSGVPLMVTHPRHAVSVAIQRFADSYAPVLPMSARARAAQDRDSRLGCSPHQGGSNAGTTA